MDSTGHSKRLSAISCISNLVNHRDMTYSEYQLFRNPLVAVIQTQQAADPRELSLYNKGPMPVASTAQSGPGAAGARLAHQLLALLGDEDGHSNTTLPPLSSLPMASSPPCSNIVAAAAPDCACDGADQALGRVAHILSQPESAADSAAFVASGGFQAYPQHAPLAADALLALLPHAGSSSCSGSCLPDSASGASWSLPRFVPSRLVSLALEGSTSCRPHSNRHDTTSSTASPPAAAGAAMSRTAGVVPTQALRVIHSALAAPMPPQPPQLPGAQPTQPLLQPTAPCRELLPASWQLPVQRLLEAVDAAAAAAESACGGGREGVQSGWLGDLGPFGIVHLSGIVR